MSGVSVGVCAVVGDLRSRRYRCLCCLACWRRPHSQVEVQSAGGSYTDVGICTGAASLHRDNYDALLGVDQHSWVVSGKSTLVHNGSNTTIPVAVEAVSFAEHVNLTWVMWQLLA